LTQKILGQAGTSLADAYDVEGSVVGVEELDAHAVKTVHELGGTMFSERISGTIANFETGDILQTITFNSSFTIAGAAIRLLGVALVADVTARILNASLHISDLPGGANDMPIMAWESGDDEVPIRVKHGGVVASEFLLQPAQPPYIPNLLFGSETPGPVPQLNLRGITATFGAGTVNLICIAYFAVPMVQGLSSKGLPYPSW